MRKKISFIKKGFLLLFIAFFSEIIFASLPTSNHNSNQETRNAKNIMIPIGKNKGMISLYDLSRIDKNSLEKLTGKKMNILESWSFKSAQKKLKKSIREDGFVKNEKLSKELAKSMGNETGFHLGGFALGFFLGLIGILIAYIAYNRDYEELRKNRIKWAWVGWGVYMIIYLAIVILILSQNSY